jgi:transposase
MSHCVRGGKVAKTGRGVPFRGQSRVLVKRLREYFEKEKVKNGPLLPYQRVTERVAQALGTSRKCVSNICNDPSDVTPGKSRPRKKHISELDNFSETSIRNVIYEIYRNKVLPTRQKILKLLNERDIFHGSISTLSIVLKNIGFKWKKINNRKFLMEKPEIMNMRFEFLNEISKTVFEEVVFIDETWVNAGHVKTKAWIDDTPQSSRKEPTGKGGRLIILHAGTSKGFIPNALKIFKSKKEGDYHKEMNAKVFKEWFVSLLTKVAPHTTFVMDNASYHSVQVNKPPNQSSLKKEIVEWLYKNEINFEKTATKPQLLQLVKANKSKKTYELDELAASMGHKIVRLPPYHCQYNPIELIWAQVKGKVADRNMTFTLTEVERLLGESISEITANDWQKAVLHTKEIIDEAKMNEGYVEEAVDELIIQVRDGMASDDESDNSIFSDSSTDTGDELIDVAPSTSGTSSITGVFPLSDSE